MLRFCQYVPLLSWRLGLLAHVADDAEVVKQVK